jgi:NADH dehydrogenase
LAQVAEQEAKNVAKNIYLSITDKNLEPFVYRHRGTMISLGRWMAMGEISGFVFGGCITWWVWRTLYLSKLISLRKKVKVALDWTINIFSPRDISEL